jgi:hypothetical protein
MRVKKFNESDKLDLGCKIIESEEYSRRVETVINFDFKKINPILLKNHLSIQEYFFKKYSLVYSPQNYNYFSFQKGFHISVLPLRDNYFIVHLITNKFIGRTSISDESLKILCDDTFGLENLPEFLIKNSLI